MVHEEGYAAALQRIKQAKASGATNLDLSRTGLTSVPPETWTLTALEVLDLSQNKLPTISTKIGNLTKLRELYLSNNQLAVLPAEVGSLAALSVLSLPNNRLASLPEEIGNLAALRLLQVSENELTSLPSEIGSLTALGRLLLDANQIASLPPKIGNLENLEQLVLSNNRLTSLPAEIGNLAALTTLDLRTNRLKFLPVEIGNLAALTELYLHDNQLTSLPAEIGNLPALTTLGLSKNHLRSLPAQIGNLAALTKLSLNHNRFTSAPLQIGRLAALQELWLHNNQLKFLPAEIGNLRVLTRLDLDNNELRFLPPQIGNLAALTELRLGNNRLTSLPAEIGNLATLTTLFLDINRLTSLPAQIGNLATLTTLFLANNQLTSLPAEIGNLAALTQLSLSRNQLTSLPGEIGNLAALVLLGIRDNPLPPELLAIDSKGVAVLLAYLRSLPRRSPVTGAAAKSHVFNEAKLLLVGPGEVGKTWLLEALMDKVPTAIGSTKGFEIVRVPMNVKHDASGRTIRFNCWDFGGQDLYQVTQQIFFSPNAVYLLVWKPRPGIDPQLEHRLERIRVSACAAGQRARVFIVATHASDDVPAVISEHALREKYGDLIPEGGFHHVDSAAGPDGKGIARLKECIVNAAASLSGLALEYAPEWAAAHKAIRAIDRPSIPFSEFRAVCTRAGMQEADASILAIMMDVQGHVSYFADAGTDGEELSGVSGDDNIVVLRPEWLAKAVTFVLEDKETRGASGILRHARLREIWREDSKRACPGYEEKLHRYFLWLMWKFDIAYRQSDKTSLLPELIDRGRPDDLRWTPSVELPSGLRQAELICRVNQTPPDRMVSVLSAAAHSLRRRHAVDETGTDGGRADTLDRNWRTGFFLDSERRGECFVELDEQARQLWFTTRDAYPADLTKQLEQTLRGIIKERWPNLMHDFAVPCRGTIGAKRCPHSFDREFLIEERGETVKCEKCRKQWRAESLLDGFEPGQEKIIEMLQGLSAGQSQLLVMALRTYRDLMNPQRDLINRAPCMFTVLPEDIAGWKGFTSATEKHVRVTCWCEHPDGPHPNQFGSFEPMASYVIKAHREWVRKAKPYINWAAMLLKAFVPLAGSVVKQGLSEDLSPTLGKEIELMGDVSKAIPTGKLDTLDGDRKLDDHYGSRPEIDSLRHIQHAILDEKNVKKSLRWGGLRPVLTKTGEVLWLCERHAAIQSPPVPESLG